MRRRWLLAGAMLCCAAPGMASETGEGPAAGGADWAGGFVLAGLERWHLNPAPLNNGGFPALPRRTATLAGLLEGGWQGLTWRARVETQQRDAGAAHNATHGTLQELNRVFELGGGATLSLGKRLYALDPSFVNQPLGFLQKRTDLGDPLDELGQSEGLPMAVLAWNGERASVAAIYSHDALRHVDGDNRGLEQTIVKFGYEFDGVGATLLLRRADGEGPGIGAALNGAVGDTLAWYGAAYHARRDEWPVAGSIAAAGTSGATQELAAVLRHGGNRRYQRATIGIVATPRQAPRLQAEYAYDGRGLSDSQYARRRYLSITLSHTVAGWEVGGGVYAGRDDGTTLWHGSATYRYSSRTRLMLSVLRQGRPGHSERALAPVGGRLALRWWWLL